MFFSCKLVSSLIKKTNRSDATDVEGMQSYFQVSAVLIPGTWYHPALVGSWEAFLAGSSQKKMHLVQWPV